MTVFDCETDKKGNLLLVGVMTDGKYFYFKTAQGFWNYIMRNKITQLFAHNIEFDFFKIQEYIPGIKFTGYYSTAGLSYIQAGNIFIKDTMNHLPYSLKFLGDVIGKPKYKIDYNTLRFNKKLIRYNKRDCEITYEIVKTLEQVYIAEGSKPIKSTTGSQSMNIYLRRFFCQNFYGIPFNVLSIWRHGYKGGLVEVYKQGKYKNKTFYKIDINSLYPFLMRTCLPYPYDYRRSKKLNKKDRNKYYWLGVVLNRDKTVKEVYNSIEHRNKKCTYYFVFKRKCYPFRKYVDYFYNKRKQSTGLIKEIYKKLLNSLYGKFGQRFELDIISNYQQKNKNWYYMEQIKGDLYRIKYVRTKGKFWVNVVWSLFITAKAREYMRRLKKYCERFKIVIYYLDTDCFICSGDINKISNLIDNKKLGLFKLEGKARVIDIRGKKFYMFGSKYKCKGVPLELRKKFFDKGEIKYNKMVRYKEGITRGLRIGSFVEVTKRNIKNLPSNN